MTVNAVIADSAVIADNRKRKLTTIALALK
jgi:hypothetical protein